MLLLLVQLLEVLVLVLKVLHEDVNPLGLKVSWKKKQKTIQSSGDMLGNIALSIHECGMNVEVTIRFRNICSVVHNNSGSKQDWSDLRCYGFSQHEFTLIICFFFTCQPIELVFFIVKEATHGQKKSKNVKTWRETLGAKHPTETKSNVRTTTSVKEEVSQVDQTRALYQRLS